jgi:hypothetical protein
MGLVIESKYARKKRLRLEAEQAQDYEPEPEPESEHPKRGYPKQQVDEYPRRNRVGFLGRPRRPDGK